MLRLPILIKIAFQFDTAVDYRGLHFYTAEVSLVLSFVGGDSLAEGDHLVELVEHVLPALRVRYRLFELSEQANGFLQGVQ